MREYQVGSFLNADFCIEAFGRVAHADGPPRATVDANGSRSHNLPFANIAAYPTTNVFNEHFISCAC